MSNALFVDIPLLDDRFDENTKSAVERRMAAQDVINILAGIPKPYQMKRKQFSRGILIIASFIENKGHNPAYITFDKMNEKAFENAVNRADVVAITGNNTAYFNVVKKVCSRIKEIDKDVLTVVGGYHVSALDRESLQECKNIDVVIRGEGEATFLDIVENKILDEIPGITFRNGKTGEIKRNDDRPPLDPGVLPFPAYHILPGNLREYNYNVQTIMGCKFQCNYCTNGYFWKQPRIRDFEKTIEEFEFLNSVLPKNTLVHISDNIFSLQKERTVRLCQEFYNRGFDLIFSCDLRPNYADPYLVKCMVKAGFIKVYIGFEDANDPILLHAAKRGANFQACINTAKMIKNNSSFSVEGYWILGLPGSTQDTMKYTVETAKHLIRNNTVDAISSSTIFTPLPGTPMFHNPEKYGMRILSRNWDEYLRSNYYPVYELTGMSRDEICRWANIFEDVLFEEYIKKLGMTRDQVLDLHRKLMTEEGYKELMKRLDERRISVRSSCK